MSLTPIGLMAMVAGFICLLLGYRATATVFVAMILFGSASALFIGSANIQPAYLFLGFVAVASLTRRREALVFVHALHPSQPGFWLACFTVYGVVSAFILPRILAGTTQIIPLGLSAQENIGGTVPLAPVSGNLTQSVYLIGNLVCFAMFVAIASTRGGFEAVFRGLIAYAAGNILFALLDVGTYATGTQYVLGFMRNATYVLHTDTEVDGMKRIVGSFTEASSFARSTLGVLGLTGTLWLCGYRPFLTGALALASLVLLALSTSSAGLVGMPIVLLVLYWTALMRSGLRASDRYSAAAVICAPPVILATIAITVLDGGIWTTMHEYFDLVVLDKLNSDSGIERSTWNAVALQNFFDSWGFGVGLGTARTSSLALALLSNVGIPAILFYVAFIAIALARPRGVLRTFPSDVRLSARNACLGLLIGDLLVSSVVDQGLFFYVLAAVASTQPDDVPTGDRSIDAWGESA